MLLNFYGQTLIRNFGVAVKAQKSEVTNCVVLSVWWPVSDAAAACRPYSGGQLTEKLPADLPGLVYTRNLPYLTVESRNGDLLLASVLFTF